MSSDPNAKQPVQMPRRHSLQILLVLVSLALSVPAMLAGCWWDDYLFASPPFCN